MRELSEKYLSWEEVYRFKDLTTLGLEDYFKLIEKFQPMFKNSDFSNVTPAFYINYIKDDADDNFGSLRIRYYSTKPIKTKEIIQNFLANHAKDIVEFKRKSHVEPDFTKPLTSLNSSLAFVSFLNINTKIILDLLKNYGVLPLQKLVLEYRFVHFPSRVAPENILEPIFFEHSEVYRELKEASLDKLYWEDLTRRFGTYDFGLHFLANPLNPFHENLGYPPNSLEEGWITR